MKVCNLNSKLLKLTTNLYEWQSLIPVVMAGIIAVYSLVIAVLINGDLKVPPARYSLYEYVAHPIRNCQHENDMQNLVASCIWGQDCLWGLQGLQPVML